MIERDHWADLTSARLRLAQNYELTPKLIEQSAKEMALGIDLSDGTGKSRITEMLIEIREDIGSKIGTQPFASETTAGLLQTVFTQKLRYAQLALSQEDIGQFMAIYDHAVGFGGLAESVTLAAMEIHSTAEDETAEIVSGLNSAVGKLSISEQASLYIDARKKAKSYANLLQKDPSGFLLVDELMASIKSNSLGITSELVAAGAKNAGDLYKQLYPLAAGI